jgi:nitrite reductase (NADH) large subunit
LFSQEPVYPYFRPRVAALAFGLIEMDAMHLRPQRWYEDNGVELRLNAPVTHIDAQAKTVTAAGKQERFDALIIAAGAGPVLLPLTREFPEDIIALWSAAASLAIRRRLSTIRRLVILGGGISGIESALYAREAGLEATVVEKMGRLMSAQFGVKAAAVLTHRLQEKGIRVVMGRYAVSISKRGGKLDVALDDGSEVCGDLILTTVGATRRLELYEQAGIRTDRGVVVDEYLQTSAPGVFACGDIAQRDHLRTATVLRAHQHGRSAGENAVAFLQGRPLEPVPEPISPLFFKHKDVEFYSVGAPADGTLEEKTLLDDGKTGYCSVLLDKGLLCGVQMIGSHEGFRPLADLLGQPWRDIESRRPW